LDVKPREDVSHNHNCLYIHIFKIKKSKNQKIKKYKNQKIKKNNKEREASAGLHISGMIAFSISHL
jgi:hypothetical protein